MRSISLRTALVSLTVLVSLFFLLSNKPMAQKHFAAGPPHPSHETYRLSRVISGDIGEGETFFDIFKRHGLNHDELFRISRASRTLHNISRLYKGRPYSLRLDDNGSVRFLSYQPDDFATLNVIRTDDGGYLGGLIPIEYERKTTTFKGIIEDNLVSAIESDLVALDLSDIFAWDIDFNTDLRKGDAFSVVVEELWRNGKFVRYGNVLAATIVNDNKPYSAYRYKNGNEISYFNAQGTELRRSLLKAPLSYRRISSGFTRKRFHPILRKYRPHLGIDYSAARGTPVSSVGDGIVKFAGRKGPNGKLVIIKHRGGITTYYGHLHRIAKGIRKGVRLKQGRLIGTVGSTGRATGPHLDYRIKRNGRFINPLRLRLPKGAPVKKELFDDYLNTVRELDLLLETAPGNMTAARTE
jgi:murein DD-endopeptidase MepM/ murein hydrolase activator NlpD